MNLWRISKFADLSGRGGLLADGRWHRKGIPVVYCCDHPSTALLEILVHMNRWRIPPSFQLLRIECPDDVTIFNHRHKAELTFTKRELEALNAVADGVTTEEIGQRLGIHSRTIETYLAGIREKLGAVSQQITDHQLVLALMKDPSLHLNVSQTIGSSLLQKGEFALIRVRSAIMPQAWNYLLNPLHEDAKRITVAEIFEYPFDSRLLS